MSVTIMVNDESLILHDDVIQDSGLQTENVYDEEELSEALLGKEVTLRFTDNIVTYLLLQLQNILFVYTGTSLLNLVQFSVLIEQPIVGFYWLSNEKV